MNTLKKDWKPDLGLKHILLTIKCLLIVPNPESALNEEAGKLLLEQYDVSQINLFSFLEPNSIPLSIVLQTYSSRARLYTEIHAGRQAGKTEVVRRRPGQDPEQPASSTARPEQDKKGKLSKNTKRTLKRL